MHPRGLSAPAVIHAEIKGVINPHLCLRDQNCVKSPDTFYERLTPLWQSSHLCLLPGDTSFSQEIQQETKKQTDRQRVRETWQAKNIIFFFSFFTSTVKASSIFQGDLFNEMTSFLQESVVNGFHTILLATGDLGRWRAREQYLPPECQQFPIHHLNCKTLWKTLYKTVHGISPAQHHGIQRRKKKLCSSKI